MGIEQLYKVNDDHCPGAGVGSSFPLFILDFVDLVDYLKSPP
jgi:hypothetical protein